MKQLLSGACAALLGVVVTSAFGAPVPVVTETLKDRKDYVPYRKYESLPGKVIGVMVSDVVAVMGQDGRSGPPDAIAFSRNAGSYRWVYTPARDQAIITALQVRTGEKGDVVKIYPKLNMANARELQVWKIDAPYALVEVEVNDALGAPGEEGFVATNMRRLDRTKEYPLDLPVVVTELKKKAEEHKKAQQKALDAAMTAAQQKWIKDQKPTGPRESKDLMYLSWDAGKELLLVRFRTRLSDGAFTEVQGGRNFDRPLPIPVPPVPPQPGRNPGFAAFPPPPPFERNIRVGTSFGIEYGISYEVDRDGEIVRTLILPPEDFGGMNEAVPFDRQRPGLPRPE